MNRGRIVIVREHGDFRSIWVEVVVFQLIAQRTNRSFLCKHRQRGIPEREVENRIKFRVNPIFTGVTANEISRVRRISFKDFSDHPQLRVLPVQSLRKIANEEPWHILDRVLSNAVDAGDSNPPERVLNFIARDFRFFLVHVGKIVAEPTIQHVAKLESNSRAAKATRCSETG